MSLLTILQLTRTFFLLSVRWNWRIICIHYFSFFIQKYLNLFIFRFLHVLFLFSLCITRVAPDADFCWMPGYSETKYPTLILFDALKKILVYTFLMHIFILPIERQHISIFPLSGSVWPLLKTMRLAAHLAEYVTN